MSVDNIILFHRGRLPKCPDCRGKGFIQHRTGRVLTTIRCLSCKATGRLFTRP